MSARFPLAGLIAVVVPVVSSAADISRGEGTPPTNSAVTTFRRDIQPILEKYCYDCHGNGVDKAGVRLDPFDDPAALHDPKLWLRALKNVRAGIMPPADEGPFPADDAARLMQWIKRDAFGLDPAQPDPGRVCFPNGAIPAKWWPEGGEADFQLKATLAPLDAVRQRLQILGGLDHANARGGADGAGDHARGNGVFLTGVRLNKSATDIRAGISIDQVIAKQVGHLTRFPSLELTCDANRQSGGCDSGYSCAYQYNISWQSPTTPMTPENNPRLVFERLFGPGAHGERAVNAQTRLNARRSVLDFVSDDARRMHQRLGRDDQEKLDQYLTGVREVETRIQQAERFGPNTDPDQATPAGIPQNHADYVDLMYDMMLLAFKTDSTRVATFVLGHDGDNRSFTQIGISEGHHDLSHHQNNEERIEKIGQIDRWYVERFAAFLRRLDATEDIDGKSLLHNSRIVYGSGNADGNRHSHDNLPVVLAGAGGGALSAERFVQHGSKPLSNLFLSLADQAGVSGLERFGDSTARLGHV